MKLFKLYAKSQLASLGKIQELFSGENSFAEHLQEKAECTVADLLANGDTEPLSALNAMTLGGPIHDSKL